MRGSIYIITNERLFGEKDPIGLISDLLKAGANIIQLRDKDVSTRDLIKIGHAIKKLTARFAATFIVNDRPDIAYACDADGLHVGQEDIPIAVAREILGKEKEIGVSTHSLDEARRARLEGADYISVGPIFHSSTKPHLKPVGVKLLKDVRKEIGLPIVAIGGITPENVEEVLAAGTDTVAVSSFIFDRPPAGGAVRAVKEFKAKIKGVRPALGQHFT